MCVPGQVYVEGWDGNLHWVGAQNAKVAFIFGDEALHGSIGSRRVDPIDGMHFLNERALANDSADQVESKRRRVLPIARHHSSNRDLFELLQGTTQ